jgi:hypothetical protein
MTKQAPWKAYLRRRGIEPRLYSVCDVSTLDERLHPTFATNRPMMPPRPPLNIVKLSDHFGQYVLMLMCECGHTRTAQPWRLG